MSSAVVIGGGPAGLMAAECLAAGGVRVDLYDAMPSVGRKFLLAGVGGMNITHSEPLAAFLQRYGPRQAWLQPLLEAFGPDQLRQWVHALGIETFVGSSGRVFPRDMKAAPLLRAWLHRLRQAGVRLHPRHRWRGWDADGRLLLEAPTNPPRPRPDVLVLALGGGSWARLGSDGAWVEILARRGIPVAPLQPANCGFELSWSEHFASRFAGAPVKPVVASCLDPQGQPLRRQGEFVVSAQGVEGSLIYALSAALRERIARAGSARLELDLAPARTRDELVRALSRPRQGRSLSEHLRRCAGISGVRAGLLREVADTPALQDPARLADLIKALPLDLRAPRPLDEAISSAGGLPFEALDSRLMLRDLPGVFCAGEMLDWEAPTGGYLLTACFASGRAAGLGALEWLGERPPRTPGTP